MAYQSSGMSKQKSGGGANRRPTTRPGKFQPSGGGGGRQMLPGLMSQLGGGGGRQTLPGRMPQPGGGGGRQNLPGLMSQLGGGGGFQNGRGPGQMLPGMYESMMGGGFQNGRGPGQMPMPRPGGGRGRPNTLPGRMPQGMNPNAPDWQSIMGNLSRGQGQQRNWRARPGAFGGGADGRALRQQFQQQRQQLGGADASRQQMMQMMRALMGGR